MPVPDNRSIGELVAQLAHETRVLVRQEVELASTEMAAKAKIVASHVATVAIGGALAHAALLVLLAALVIGLSQLGITPWLSAAIVGVGTLAVGYVFVTKGMNSLRGTSVVPSHTVDSLKEDATWTTRQGA